MRTFDNKSQSATQHTSVNTSNRVYILSSDYAWMPALVVSTPDANNQVTVSVPRFRDEQSISSVSSHSRSGKATKYDSQTISLSSYPSQSLPLQNVDKNGVLQLQQDMVNLPFLHEAAILFNLKARHLQGLPYTRTGDIIIAVNPYQWMHDLYTDRQRHFYAQRLVWQDLSQVERDPRSAVDPHVYETSALSYRGLAVEGQDQSILVSGESGAGKTETVKILLSHLAYMGNHPPNSSSKSESPRSVTHPPSLTRQDSVVQRVLESNPLLEAFGNAKTVRNDNSSRFGKYLQLQFDCQDANEAAFQNKMVPDCILAGSKCEVYLLEKSRVVGHEAQERTYHVFYQLLAAPDATKREIWSGLVGATNESFRYVGWTDTDTIEGQTDAMRFQLTLDALAQVGVTGELKRTLLRAICMVLQLGNLTFAERPRAEEEATISSRDQLEVLAELMGVDPDVVEQSLTQRTIRAGSEEYKVPLNVAKAKDSCDAFAKEIYAKAFLWLVRTINDATCAERNYENGQQEKFGVIGLLDIFGFESFKVNRFEQLCINYANEKLQQKFTQDVFQSVQAEYKAEGIELAEIVYEDNANVLDLVEGRVGMIKLLNEECVRPKGSDSAFVAKVASMNKASDCLIRSRNFREHTFGVQHYAGPVIYEAKNFVTKNTDTLPLDLNSCAEKCTNEIVRKHLNNDFMVNSSKKVEKKPPRTLLRRKSSLVAETVWTKFRNQLTSLMGSLRQTRTRYIRCIKPNTQKKPKIMQHLSTVEQLRCAGVVAAVTISRSAFPNRLAHHEVLERFKSLWPRDVPRKLSPGGADPEIMEDGLRRESDILLSHSLCGLEAKKDGAIVKAFVIGRTRAYFRAGALEHLEAEWLKNLGVQAVVVQRIARGFAKRSRYLKVQRAASKASPRMRGTLVRKKFVRLRAACIVVQSSFRMVAARTAYRKMLLAERKRKAEARRLAALRKKQEAEKQRKAAAAAAAAAAATPAIVRSLEKDKETDRFPLEDTGSVASKVSSELTSDELTSHEGVEVLAMSRDIEAGSAASEKLDADDMVADSGVKRPRKRRRYFLILGGILIAATAAVVGVLVGGGGGNNGNSAVITGADGQTDNSPLAQLILSKSLNDGSEFADPESYQNQAFQWLKLYPTETLSEQKILQLYSLACIYYSTYSVRTLFTDAASVDKGTPPPWTTSTGWLVETDECTWYGISCSDGLVSKIYLQENGLTGSFAPETVYLKESLTDLDISKNIIWNSGDAGNSWLGSMTKMKILRIGGTRFEYDGIPSQIGLMTDLNEFDCSDTLYSGPLNGAMWSGLTDLQILDISLNAIDSPIPTELASLPRITNLYAVDSGLTGDLISLMNNFKVMFELWIDNNPGISGGIPSEIGKVKTLFSLSLTACDLGGPIPTQMGLLKDLAQVWMYSNPLTGTIPSEIANLRALEIFDVADTDLTGTMPEEVCDLVESSDVLETLWADCAEPDPEVVCDCCTECS